MSKVVTMIESGSIMLLSVLAVSMIYSRFARQFWTVSVLLGVLFAFVGMLVMENSVEIVQGIRTDPRGAVVVLSAAFGGPVSVAITAPCLAVLRLVQGGVGAVPGATYIVGVGIVAGLAWIWWFRIAKKSLDIQFVLVQAVIAGTVPTIVLLFVSAAPWDVFLTSNLLSAPTNFGAVLLMGTMLVRDLDRANAIKLGEEKQAQINAISAHAPVALFQIVREPHGAARFTYVSQSAMSILGVHSDELLRDFNAVNQISKAAIAEEITSNLDASEKDFAPWSADIECMPRQGNEKWLRIHSGIRKDSDDRVIWDGSVIDITEEKIAAKLKDEFIATVSHELRTPLTSIRGALGLVIGSASSHLPEKVRHMLGIANRNSERLVLLINDILDMQKIRSGQMQFSLSVEDVRPIAANALASSENYAPDKGISLVFRDTAPGIMVKIDPIRFEQVLTNLLSNAIKFAPEGSTVTLSLLSFEDKLRVSVKDEGIGISAEFRDKIFNPFSQSEASSTRSIGGTGLGLSISKALVEAMDGQLSFDSIEGHGATFHIDLPAIERSADFAHRSAVSGASGQRLLVCSNDQAFTRTLAEVAQGCDLSADVVGNFDAAFNLARTGGYAALTLDADTVAPISFLEQLRQTAQTHDLPVIVASKDGKGTFDGAVTIVAKESDKSALDHSLRAALPANRSQSHVLYVEDDVHLQQIFQQNFGETVRMTGARTLAEARASIARNQFDLVLLDLELPDGHGAHLLQEVEPSIPFIVFSAHDVDRDITERAVSVMTKSRVKETDVVEAVLTVLKDAGQR
ncbi:ATP-binding protein [Vannielia sp. SX4]|uniref:ATP-binding protein n=1 Tax=Vannielia sp. SX4 TaxID=3463852 RepID=UPI0040595C1D